MGTPAWRRTVQTLEEVLFPGRCLVCGGWLLGPAEDGAPVCTGCRSTLERIGGPRCACCGISLVSERRTCLRCRGVSFGFLSHRSLFAYTGGARRLLAGLKFQGRRRLGPFYAALVAEDAAVQGWGLVVVPVPPRPGRHGPDAVELVARTLSARHGFEVQRILAREPGVQQKTLDYEQRKANLVGRIRLPDSLSAAGIPVRAILLDDVFTTGATLDACARVLKEAGCAEVNAITLVMEE